MDLCKGMLGSCHKPLVAVTCEKPLPSGTSLFGNLGKKRTDRSRVVLGSVSSTCEVGSACDVILKVRRSAILPGMRVRVWGRAGEQK